MYSHCRVPCTTPSFSWLLRHLFSFISSQNFIFFIFVTQEITDCGPLWWMAIVLSCRVSSNVPVPSFPMFTHKFFFWLWPKGETKCIFCAGRGNFHPPDTKLNEAPSPFVVSALIGCIQSLWKPMVILTFYFYKTESVTRFENRSLFVMK